MKESDLKNITTEELIKKEEDQKMFVGIFIGAAIALIFFAWLDYYREGNIEKTTIGILICTFGGMFSLLPGLKAVRKELKSR